MFAKVIFTVSLYLSLQLLYCMKVKDLEKGQFLYQKGDDSQYWYFVLRGKLEILVDNSSGDD